MNLTHRNRVRISRHCREILPLRSPLSGGEGFYVPLLVAGSLSALSLLFSVFFVYHTFFKSLE